MALATLNKIVIVGAVGNDPILRHTQKGNAVTNLSVATDRKVKNPDGTWKSETDWHRAVVWGRRAQICTTYLKKGNRVYLLGVLQNRTWTDKEGRQQREQEILVQDIKFLGGKKKEDAANVDEALLEASEGSEISEELSKV